MPFARVTLINNSPHTVDATLDLVPAPPAPVVVVAPPQTTVEAPQGGGLVQKIKATSSVGFPAPPRIYPAVPLGGRPGDDITEVIVYVSPGFPPQPPTSAITARIVNGGVVQWQTQTLA